MLVVLMHVLLFSCMVRKPSTSRYAQRVLDGRHGVMLVVLMHVLALPAAGQPSLAMTLLHVAPHKVHIARD